MDLVVRPDGTAVWGARRFRAALGKAGISAQKREGDGATPAGKFLLREVLYRADRMARPKTKLRLRALTPGDGWCDDPADPRYNRPVRLPYAASAEKLWREDGLYDLIVPLGYNDDPPQAGRGSAIFLHLARAGYAPTEGCVALALDDLSIVIAEADPASRAIIG